MNEPYSINQNLLKIAALISMTVNHVAIIFFDREDCFGSYIGRIAMPLFIYLLTYNFLYRSRDTLAYIKRIFFFALLSQVPFYMAFGETEVLNILFTLGTLALLYYFTLEYFKRSGLAYYIISLIVLVMFFIFSILEIPITWDYGFAAYFVGISFLCLHIHRSAEYLIYSIVSLFFLNDDIQSYIAILTYLPIMLLLSFRIRWELSYVSRNKHFFYLYYPLHLLLLVLCKRLL